MAETSQKVVRYRSGPFELDPGQGSLARNGIRVRLQDLPHRLLLMLVERRGDTVTREELRQHLWPEALSLDDLGELLRQRGELDAAEANLRLGKTAAEEIWRRLASAMTNRLACGNKWGKDRPWGKPK